MSESAVYLLHFERPLAHARHYVGFVADGDAQRRLQEHLRGEGSPLVRAVVAAGIAVRLVLVMPGDRQLERRLKNRHGHAPAFCPSCRARRAGARQLKLRLFKRERRAAAPDPGRMAA